MVFLPIFFSYLNLPLERLCEFSFLVVRTCNKTLSIFGFVPVLLANCFYLIELDLPRPLLFRIRSRIFLLQCAVSRGKGITFFR